jgi:threonine aldolase
MGPHEVEDAILTSRSLKIDLICLENTHMNAGGAVVPPDNISQICDVAHRHSIPTHLDGARIFNAAAALGIPADRVVKDVDSIMFCLSKGLCAPVGSMLAGSRDFIAKAKQMRRVVGGQMRQAGVIAAAGILALEKMVDRLNEDHENARFLAEGLSSIEGIELDLDDVQTNLVFFDVGGLGMDAKAFASKLLDEWNIKIDAREKSLVRALTYKDITRQDVEYVVNAIREASAR